MRSWWLFSAALVTVAAACATAELKQATPSSSSDPEGPYEGECPDEPCEGIAAPPSAGLDAGRDASVDGGTLAVSGGVTIQVQPSDNGAALLSAIRGAKKSVHMTMYLLTNKDVIDALGDLKEAGKDVKVILNQEFPPNGGDNTPAYNTLTSRGVAVRWAPSGFTFTHAKTIGIDAEKVIIMTMNMTYSSASTNREYIATDTDPRDVADVETLFAADYENKPVTVASKLVVSPKGANTLDPRAHLTTFMNSATTSLDVEVQSLSDDGIVDAIILAHQAHVAVRVVIDGDTSTSAAQKKTITRLKEFGVPLRSLKNPDLHAKAIVVDGKKAFVGSQNMTNTALFQNREVGVIVDSATEAAKVSGVIAQDFNDGSAL